MKEITCCDIMPGKYFIDEGVNVFSVYKNGYVFKCVNKDGYILVNIRNKNHKNIHMLLHKLMMLTFVGNPDSSMKNPTIDHIDGNRQNNHIDNLRYLERVNNSSLKHSSVKGEKNGRSKLTEENVKDIINHLKLKDISIRKIANIYGVNERSIRDIRDKRNWTYMTENIQFE